MLCRFPIAKLRSLGQFVAPQVKGTRPVSMPQTKALLTWRRYPFAIRNCHLRGRNDRSHCHLGFHVTEGASLLPSAMGYFPPSRGQQATQFTRLAERISDGWRTWTTPGEGCSKPFRLRRGRALCRWIPVDAGRKSRVKGATDRLVQGKPLRRKGQGRHAALARQERASFQRIAAIISRAQVLV